MAGQAVRQTKLATCVSDVPQRLLAGSSGNSMPYVLATIKRRNWDAVGFIQANCSCQCCIQVVGHAACITAAVFSSKQTWK
jgi:hypothetical protein